MQLWHGGDRCRDIACNDHKADTHESRIWAPNEARSIGRQRSAAPSILSYRGIISSLIRHVLTFTQRRRELTTSTQ